MAAHLYWRINVSADNGGANLSIGDLSLYVAGAASHASTGGTPSASTVNGSQTADKGFDETSSTYWQATTSTGWLRYQYASAVDIAIYGVTSSNQAVNQAPKAWTLEWSDDGSAWTVADTVVGQTNWSTQTQRWYAVGANAGVTASGGKVPDAAPAFTQTPALASLVQQSAKAPATAARTVSGTVTVGGVATGGLLVRAYAKATGEYIGQATSAGDGTYSINCGNVWADVYVIAFDPTTYRAVTYDQIVPG
ncbi:conserved protein of unknown function [Cupriavidus taiwanensis]|uniref:F5/8 type C domain-containing protein n=1 Tax=Cupriavidus taiwanensis TaxID=164546 RepID=A0A375IG13_9BURK|nr:hypothetical protein [Cupriavidus taiwanensis]SPK73723.1 conserved protein of unknown function [Cupriavidus taiwanensis]